MTPIDIGPGTRLLCVDAPPSPWGGVVIHNLTNGRIYTCREVHSVDEFETPACNTHGSSCRAGAVGLCEETLIDTSDGVEVLVCLTHFHPIGGSLPESILRTLDVPELVPA